MSGRSQFTPTRGPEQFKDAGGNIGGTLIQGRTSFSLSGSTQNQYVSPILNAALPGGTRAETLNLRQMTTGGNINGLVDHAVTKDQTLRVSFNSNERHAREPWRRQLRPSGARVHSGEPIQHDSGSRSRTDRPPLVHQHAAVAQLAALHDLLGDRRADDRRAGCVHERRRAADGRCPRAHADARVRRRLRARHPLVAGRRADRRPVVQLDEQLELSRDLRVQQPRGVRGGPAGALHAITWRSGSQLPEPPGRLLFPGRHQGAERPDRQSRRALQRSRSACRTRPPSSRGSG